MMFEFVSVNSRHDDSWHQPRGIHSPSSSSIKSFDLQRPIESLARESDSGSEDEFFDCQGLLNVLRCEKII